MTRPSRGNRLIGRAVLRALLSLFLLTVSARLAISAHSSDLRFIGLLGAIAVEPVAFDDISFLVSLIGVFWRRPHPEARS